ncbi:hypothetical protein ACFFS2_03500 [Streptomyces aurantiacus]|uniref:XRE family transcriptional regulator n=1 Tax=Streptomyces aurantiacus TaxID=47760 RepID=A0A7G1PB30_9ACTN|nr:hypothetical protein [Streptomyces aurantiacus]BCL31016.1 hypothetical protein GCM10017557_58750 [Streptomyces aurantiacus]
MAEPDASQNAEAPDGVMATVQGTFAERLDYLCRNDPRGPLGDVRVSEMLREAGLPTASDTYVWQLRTGRRDNPTKNHIEGFARLFGVPVKYFFEDDTVGVVNKLLKMLNALKGDKRFTDEQLHSHLGSLTRLLESGVRAETVLAQLEALARLNEAGVTLDTLKRFEEAGVTSIAMRAVGLSEQGLNAAAAMLDQVRRLEGLPAESDQDQY